MTSSLLLLALVGAGCSDCGGKEVPFKRHSAQGATGDGGAGDSAGPPQGVSLPPGQRMVELGELRFEHAEADIRAALALDLDGDGHRDLLLVTADADGHGAVERVMWQQDRWQPPRLLAKVERADPVVADGQVGASGCELREASIEPLGEPRAVFAAVRADLACPSALVADLPEGLLEAAASAARAAVDGPPSPEPAAPPAAAPPAPSDPLAPPPTPAEGLEARDSLWLVLGLGVDPRVVYRLGLPATQPPPLSLSLRVADLDADDHPDLQLSLRVPVPGDSQGHGLSLSLFNRPAGLAPDAAQPEQGLLELANQAKRQRRGKPEEARTLALRVLAVHDRLCRESGRAVLRVNGAQGLPCGPSLSAGRAGSVLVALMARAGEVLEALELDERLQADGYRMSDNDRARIAYAFEALGKDGGFGWQRGPTLRLAAGPKLQPSPIAFIDEARVLVRGAPAQQFTVGQSALEPTPIEASPLLLDPTGRLAAVELFRSCSGYQLSLVDASQVVAGVVAGAPRAQPLMLAAEPPDGARCPQLSPAQRADQGGFRPLGWAMAGIVFARGPELWLLPMEGQGEVTGDAHALFPTDVVPALTYAGLLDAAGERLVVPTARGLAITTRGQAAARWLPPPETGLGRARAAALSPSGKRVAAVFGSTLWIARPAGELAAASEAAPAAAPAPAAPAALPPHPDDS